MLQKGEEAAEETSLGQVGVEGVCEVHTSRTRVGSWRQEDFYNSQKEGGVQSRITEHMHRVAEEV